MALYTYGGNPAAVLTTSTGAVVPDYPVLVRAAGTGALVTALYEADGVTPIAELRTNGPASDAPGAIRTFKADGVSAIEYEYNGPSGPVRWYEAGRELAQEAHAAVADALKKAEGGTVTAPVTLGGGATVASGMTVAGGATVDSLNTTGDLTVGGILDAAGGIALTGMRIFNPRIYGATGNGSTNDAPAIQAALSAAATYGGGWVIVPPGTYRLATLPLRIYRNTRLTLLPGAVFRRAADATLLLNGDADQDFGGYTGHGGLIIEGGVWDMRATTTGLTNPRMCISLGHAQNILVRGVEIRDVPGYHAIEANACKDVRIQDSRFLGFVDTGGRENSEAIQLDLAAGSGYFGGFGPYDFTPVEDVSVSGCYFGASGTAGTTAWARGVGSHSARIGRWHKRIRVTDCTFEGLVDYAVHAYSWDDVVVANCQLVNCASGVRVRTVDTARTNDTINTSGTQTSASQAQSGAVVVGCTFRNTGAEDEPIIIEGETTGRVRMVTVADNVIEQVNTQNGIRLTFVDHYAVTGNVIRDVNAGTGISQTSTTEGVVANNRIDDADVSGITAGSCTDVLIAHNHLSRLGVNGIHVTAGVRLKIDGNFIRGAARVDGNGYGIRVTTSTAGITITNNTYRKSGSGFEALNALSITAGNTGVRRFGNDWLGQGNPTDAVDASTSPNLSPYDTGA
ncbi:right-handed parallel beta-helix repeat-containing protein [Streptomyces sp. DH37]|uniref:right-handed parallel beta-helix repeat-containing protein n=1 Tax=Streptomyces sp. DH37 TaxID=3040122 RepID=UPI0024412A69|nr:right-handed parallel beta-helix repeat-containing protein [Streptomyces sp. DH37]MDG9701653.1 right-handed parallel beta-helix repeat-containing protein [Streptomyces sp. DH37]